MGRGNKLVIASEAWRSSIDCAQVPHQLRLVVLLLTEDSAVVLSQQVFVKWGLNKTL